MINCLNCTSSCFDDMPVSNPCVSGNEIAVALLLTKESVGGISGTSSYGSRRVRLVSNRLKYFNRVISAA